MALVEAEFGQAYQSAWAALLRRRFRLLCAAWALALGVLTASDVILGWAQWRWLGLSIAAHGLQLVVIGAIWQRAAGGTARATELLRLSFWMVVLNAIVASAMFHAIDPQQSVAFARIALGFLFACLILPWTPRQAVQPAFAVWLSWVLGQQVFSRVELSVGAVFADVLSAAVVLPGLGACWLRTTRLGRRVESSSLRQHYEEFHRELFDARKMHEAIFPRPRLTGAIRFAFRDEPRLGIGGDLLAAHESPDGSVSLILLDVAGDGIAAALTVHRLHGEIERLFAESPHLRPREVVAALDRYAHLTLAPHGVFATGFAMRLEASGAVRWCGAGHTPAFIRHGDGSLTPLPSTSWPLGASDCLCDDCDERIEALEGDDVLIAHSDGACDWRNRKGRRLGHHGVEAIIRTTRVADALHWPDAFMRQLSTYRGWQGEPDEDVLVMSACVGAAAAARTGLRTARFFSREATGALQSAGARPAAGARGEGKVEVGA